MDKVVISEYIIFHLTLTDLIACGAGTLIRGFFDWYQARVKIKRRKGPPFSNLTYCRDNGDRIFVSLISAFGLLLIVPELTVFFGAETWNSGFSGLIGLLAFDIVTTIQKRARVEFRKFQNGKPEDDEIL